ncbi:MAG: hypothetical protein M2R45_01485 [Verrucomicrobia subdivision 3 bacterium]|nr:hypothetical protein [Limisphaerales bacterium]MCS1413385.1 hypothetical protein [Limisphaerales bacterium]
MTPVDVEQLRLKWGLPFLAGGFVGGFPTHMPIGWAAWPLSNQRSGAAVVCCSWERLTERWR